MGLLLSRLTHEDLQLVHTRAAVLWLELPVLHDELNCDTKPLRARLLLVQCAMSDC